MRVRPVFVALTFALGLGVTGVSGGVSAGAPPDAGAVPSGAAHELVYLPAATLPQRGPRFAAVTLDVYVIFGNHPSATTAELARRAVERATDVREVLHLSTYGPSAGEPAAEAAL